MKSIIKFNHESSSLGLDASEINKVFEASKEITKTM